jgi:hypothetical protein
VLVLNFLCISSVKSQLYGGVGLDVIKGFNVSTPYYGLSLLGEKVDGNQSIYAKINMSLSRTEPQSDNLYNLFPSMTSDTNSANLTYRYNTIEIGRRNFFATDMEYGLGFFLAEHLMMAYNTVGIHTINTPANYSLPASIPKTGSVLSFSIGANAGMQYGFVRGVVYADLGFNYSLTGGIPNNITASNSRSYSGIIFTFNVGVKRALNFGY